MKIPGIIVGILCNSSMAHLQLKYVCILCSFLKITTESKMQNTLHFIFILKKIKLPKTSPKKSPKRSPQGI